MAGKSEPQEPVSSVSLTLESKLENAAVARRAVAEQARRAGLAERTSAAAQVVVTEGFTNATRHAGGPSDRVRVEAKADGHGITVAVRDRGDGFRPRLRNPNSLGGLGLLLIAALADRVQLRSLGEDGTEICARLEARSKGAGGVEAPARI